MELRGVETESIRVKTDLRGVKTESKRSQNGVKWSNIRSLS